MNERERMLSERGAKGGKARVAALTPEQRSASASAAGKASRAAKLARLTDRELTDRIVKAYKTYRDLGDEWRRRRRG